MSKPPPLFTSVTGQGAVSSPTVLSPRGIPGANAGKAASIHRPSSLRSTKTSNTNPGGATGTGTGIGTGGVGILPTHERMLDSLENDFKRVDRMLSLGEMRVFGKDSEEMFKQLDEIRRKQISLAMEHSMLNAEDAAVPNERQLDKLMSKLDDLALSLGTFHDMSNSARSNAPSNPTQ